MIGLAIELERGGGSGAGVTGEAGLAVEGEGPSLKVEENAGDVAGGGAFDGEEVESVVAREHDPAARRVIGREIRHAALDSRLRLPSRLPFGGQ